MAKITIPLDHSASKVFKTLNVSVSFVGSPLGCHTIAITSAALSWDFIDLSDDVADFKKMTEWGHPTLKRGFYTDTAHDFIDKLINDRAITDLASEVIWNTKQEYFTKYGFLLLSDNLDGHYSPKIFTRWLADYLVRVKGCYGVASQISVNANYGLITPHHNQVWVLTPPARFPYTIGDAIKIVGKIPEETNRYVVPSNNGKSAFYGKKVNYPFKSKLERNIKKYRGTK